MMVYGYFGAMTPSYESLINFEISSIVVFLTPLVAIAIIYKLFIENDIQNNLEFSVSIEKTDILLNFASQSSANSPISLPEKIT